MSQQHELVLQRDTPTAADTALRREVLARMGQLVSHGVLGFQVLPLLPLCRFCHPVGASKAGSLA